MRSNVRNASSKNYFPDQNHVRISLSWLFYNQRVFSVLSAFLLAYARSSACWSQAWPTFETFPLRILSPFPTKAKILLISSSFSLNSCIAPFSPSVSSSLLNSSFSLMIGYVKSFSSASEGFQNKLPDFSSSRIFRFHHK